MFALIKSSTNFTKVFAKFYMFPFVKNLFGEYKYANLETPMNLIDFSIFWIINLTGKNTIFKCYRDDHHVFITVFSDFS